MKLRLGGEVGADDTLRLRMAADGVPAAGAGEVVLALGGQPLLRLPLPPGGPCEAAAEIPLAGLFGLDAFELAILDGQGGAPPIPATYEGEFFEVMRLRSEGGFFDRLQVPATRVRSAALLRLGVSAAYRRAGSSFLVRAASLTILGHRLLEGPPAALAAEEAAAAAWLVQQALARAREGEARIAAQEGRPDWRDLRWTISMANVAGHVALALEDYGAARALFAVPVRQTAHVEHSPVSAVNVLTGAFLHGALCHMLGDAERARRSLVRGVQAVKPIVRASNLTENVWVIGDLAELMLVAKQCLIAAVRLGVMPEGDGPHFIDDTMQVRLEEVKGPLNRLVAAGLAPRLAAHLAAHGAGWAG